MAGDGAAAGSGCGTRAGLVAGGIGDPPPLAQDEVLAGWLGTAIGPTCAQAKRLSTHA